MTLSEIRRRVNTLKRKFARELALIKARRIAEAAVNQWNPAEPPEPLHFAQHFANAGILSNAYANLHDYLFQTIRKGERPYPSTMVRKLFPYAWDHRYDHFFRFDLPPDPSVRPAIPQWMR